MKTTYLSDFKMVSWQYEQVQKSESAEGDIIDKISQTGTEISTIPICLESYYPDISG
jgi:hypothetical protein